MPIECQQLAVSLSGHTVLRDITLTLQPGELVALVGPNGAGKSTLLRALSGDLVPNAGTLLWSGRPLCSISASQRALLRAVVPQHSSLSFDFSVEEIARMGWIPRSSQPGLTKALHWALERVSLHEKSHRFYTTLSGGEKQRTHIARALVQLGGVKEVHKGAIFLDEPTSSLDPAAAYDVLETLRTLATLGGTVLVLLHDLNLASLFADRILVLSHGQLVADGTPREVFTETLLHEVYNTAPHIVTHPSCARPMILPQPPTSSLNTPRSLL